jgi:membrane-associated PAP2 superfamily phosphatase
MVSAALMNIILFQQTSKLAPVVYRGWLRLLGMPLLILGIFFTISYGTELDQRLAATWFELQGEQWILKSHWLTETVLHQTVRQINLCLILLMMVYWLVKLIQTPHSATVRALGVLLLCLVFSFTTIALLKRLIPMECPWDLQAFGGTQPWIGLFDARPDRMSPNQCFPAGHASIGYSWLAIYFFLQLIRPRLAHKGLYCSISVGVILGFAQQLRGAHFLSHDIATAAICWTLSVLVFRSFYPWYALNATADLHAKSQTLVRVSSHQTAATNSPHP